jgi:hypothetical protein
MFSGVVGGEVVLVMTTTVVEETSEEKDLVVDGWQAQRMRRIARILTCPITIAFI